MRLTHVKGSFSRRCRATPVLTVIVGRRIPSSWIEAVAPFKESLQIAPAARTRSSRREQGSPLVLLSNGDFCHINPNIRPMLLGGQICVTWMGTTVHWKPTSGKLLQVVDILSSRKTPRNIDLIVVATKEEIWAKVEVLVGRMVAMLAGNFARKTRHVSLPSIQRATSSTSNPCIAKKNGVLRYVHKA